MAQLTVSSITQSGLALTMSASSSNGDSFSNTGAQAVLFQNSSSQGGGSSITVTFAATKVDDYGGAASLHNVAVVLASSSMVLTAVGPFRPSYFNDANGLVQFTYSAAGLYVKAVQMAQAS